MAYTKASTGKISLPVDRGDSFLGGNVTATLQVTVTFMADTENN